MGAPKLRKSSSARHHIPEKNNDLSKEKSELETIKSQIQKKIEDDPELIKKAALIISELLDGGPKGRKR